MTFDSNSVCRIQWNSHLYFAPKRECTTKGVQISSLYCISRCLMIFSCCRWDNVSFWHPWLPGFLVSLMRTQTNKFFLLNFPTALIKRKRRSFLPTYVCILSRTHVYIAELLVVMSTSWGLFTGFLTRFTKIWQNSLRMSVSRYTVLTGWARMHETFPKIYFKQF